MAKAVKSNLFKLYYPNGEWGSVRVPSLFSVRDVAEKCRDAVVVLRLPAGYKIYGRFGGNRNRVEGPCDVVWNAKKEDYVAAYPNAENVSPRELYVHAFGKAA